MSFLPISRKDMNERGWDSVDFVVITGDAYVDHPTFGAAIISRVLEDEGYRVGIIAQPDYKKSGAFDVFGAPKFGYMVTAGNIDSMVAHYTAAKRRRSDDSYSAGGKAGKRPDRAVTVYCNQIRAAHPEIPIVIGGLEASLRRFAHYDYWSDRIHRSILFDSSADLLIYGMGERQTREVAKRLATGVPVSSITDILGTCYVADSADGLEGIILPSFEEVSTSKTECAKACRIQQDEQDAVRGKRLIEPCAGKFLVQNSPMPPLSEEELDHVYALPYERFYHPSYEVDGGVPAIEEVEFSITHNRGCFGACNFCSIAFHQGRQVAARSVESVINEAKSFTKNPRFKGYIHDVGGPTANFRHPSCKNQLKNGLCKGKKCLAPTPCAKLDTDESEYVSMLRQLREIPGIKRVFIRSGIRYDYMLEDKNEAFFKDLVKYHISGQLKVAPEHCSTPVLNKMGKPNIGAYKRFSKRFYELTKSVAKEQYLVPYLMSSHPGCTLSDAVELAVFLKREKIRPEQVQDFYPTPGTLSTCMFYTGLDPYTLEPVYVPRTQQEKDMQRALLQFFRPQNRMKVREALMKCGRTDLIGNGENCLIPGSVPAEMRQKSSHPERAGGKRQSVDRKKRGKHQWEEPGKRKRK